MPRTKQPPKLRHHKSTGRDYVQFPSEKPLYLGRHGSAEAARKYHGLIAAWLENGGALPDDLKPSTPTAAPVNRAKVLVKHVVLAYMRHALRRYKPGPNNHKLETENYRMASRLLLAVAGDLPVDEIGPRKLIECRTWAARGGWTYRHPRKAGERVTAEPWCRNVINRQLGRIRHMFKHALAQELVGENVWLRLKAVDGLRAGEPDARESDPVQPVTDAHLVAVLEAMHPTIRDMLALHAATGMRPGNW